MTNQTRFSIRLLALLSVLVLSGCSCSAPMDHNHGDLPLGESQPSGERSDNKYPYGPGFEDLAGANPETVATKALTQLCSFTPEDYDNQKVIHRINGVVHPDLWSRISHDPDLVVPIVTGPLERQWISAGGTTKVNVVISGEQHPADSDVMWSRKMECDRLWSGFTKEFRDLYLVVVSKHEGQWRLQQLELLETTTGPEITSPPSE